MRVLTLRGVSPAPKPCLCGATHTSTGVMAPWVMQQPTAPARAKREYSEKPVGFSGLTDVSRADIVRAQREWSGERRGYQWMFAAELELFGGERSSMTGRESLEKGISGAGAGVTCARGKILVGQSRERADWLLGNLEDAGDVPGLYSRT